MTSNINLSGSFYPRYKELNPSFDDGTFACAEKTIAQLLSTSTSSDNPGILLGKVQSGKTRAFISTIALAFDNGFDMAIVLSKNSMALIDQTIKRLRSEFRQFVEDEDFLIYDIMRSPDSFTAWELNSKIIFVAKKQVDNLRRLATLVGEQCPAMASSRVLMIDDEADNASVGYTRRGGAVEATTIAAQVSDLRSLFAKSSFLQVTATPYSLYLQPDEIEVANVTAFKPTRPRFTELVPVPDTYVGGETYFGDPARNSSTLEGLIHNTVPPSELERLKKHDGRSLKLSEVLVSPSIAAYRNALVTFFVGGCIQRINGVNAGEKRPKKLRYSFLLHSEAGKAAHEWQGLLTETIVDSLRSAADQDEEVFSSLVETSYNDLARSLKLDGLPVPPLEVVLLAVKQALTGEEVTISKVNSDEDVSSMLDDSGQLKLRSPLNIFVGGQVLERGVTLANLIGFYYGRRPNKFQQDTVLQHSRMYGYRRRDLAVTRFYTSPGIRYAMFQMQEFDQVLRDAIVEGRTGDGRDAVQFIRQAPDGSIVPCSPNKVLVGTTQTLRSFKRLLPVGFQAGTRTGANGIASQVLLIDNKVAELVGFHTPEPVLVPLATALELLTLIEPTLLFEDDDAPTFDWAGARAALRYLSHLHSDPEQRGKVFLWAATGRESSRMAAEGSHAKYIETPDSEKTEGQMAREHAIDHPILFLLRQEGSKERGWNGAAFYWPVIRAQRKVPVTIYASSGSVE